MLANFLGKSKPINFIILLSLFICLFLYSYFSLFSNTNLEFTSLFKLTGFLGLYLIIFFFYNFVVTKNNLTFDNSYAFFIFTLLLSYFLPISIEYKVLIKLLIQILFLRKIYSLRSHNKTLNKLFDSGFWLGILFILESFFAVFSILIYVAIFIHKKGTLNNLIAPIIGFITPLIVYATYCFWYDELYLFTNLFYFSSFNNIPFNSENVFNWVSGVILFLSIVAIFLKSPKALSINNSFRKSWTLLILNLAIAVAIVVLTPTKNGTELLVLLFPMAVIIANGIELINNNLIKNVILILFLVSAFIVPILL